MNYLDYLKTAYWDKRKGEFKSKTYKRCFICRCKDHLQVHHKRYFRNGVSILFKERHNDLRLLCDRCHKFIHKYNFEWILNRNAMKRRKLRDIIKKLEKKEGEEVDQQK